MNSTVTVTLTRESAGALVAALVWLDGAAARPEWRERYADLREAREALRRALREEKEE